MHIASGIDGDYAIQLGDMSSLCSWLSFLAAAAAAASAVAAAASELYCSAKLIYQRFIDKLLCVREF